MFARGRLAARLVRIVLLPGLLLVSTVGTVGATATVVATGFANPRGIAIAGGRHAVCHRGGAQR
jgi:hypothetical protein